MALIDVKEYYLKMFQQYVELKNDMADFEQAFKDGHITEDKLVAVQDDLAQVKINCDRLAYIMFLIEAPRRKAKKEKYKKANSDLVKAFEELHADEQSVIDENTSLLKHLRAELTKLTEEDKK